MFILDMMHPLVYSDVCDENPNTVGQTIPHLDQRPLRSKAWFRMSQQRGWTEGTPAAVPLELVFDVQGTLTRHSVFIAVEDDGESQSIEACHRSAEERATELSNCAMILRSAVPDDLA